ncbi:MAG: hypothetical protein AB1414_12555, partial [bacterium]
MKRNATCAGRKLRKQICKRSGVNKEKRGNGEGFRIKRFKDRGSRIKVNGKEKDANGVGNSTCEI